LAISLLLGLFVAKGGTGIIEALGQGPIFEAIQIGPNHRGRKFWPEAEAAVAVGEVVEAGNDVLPRFSEVEFGVFEDGDIDGAIPEGLEAYGEGVLDVLVDLVGFW
jgi:hypothetical protein